MCHSLSYTNITMVLYWFVLYTSKSCSTTYLIMYYIVFGWFWLWYILKDERTIRGSQKISVPLFHYLLREYITPIGNQQSIACDLSTDIDQLQVYMYSDHLPAIDQRPANMYRSSVGHRSAAGEHVQIIYRP